MRLLSVAVAGLFLAVACSTRSSNDGSGAPSVGQPCQQSSDCASGRCVPRIGETIGGDVLGVCSHPCVGNDDCTRGWSCLATSSGTDLCQCERKNETCDGADNDCNGLIDDTDVCSCPSGTTPCGVVCADFANDPKSCGGCGHTCPSGAVCNASVCACPNVGAVVCNHACVDVKVDEKNCGGCGVICGAGMTCGDGACRCGGAKAEACDGPFSVDGGPGAFCGGDLRCHSHKTMGIGVGGTYAIAPGTQTLLFALMTPVGSDALYAQPATGQASSLYSGLGGSFRLATNGPDLVYSVSEGGAPGGKTVGCPGGVCGPVLAAERKIIDAFGAYAYWLGGTGVERCAISGCAGGPEAVGDAPAGATRLRVDATGVYLLYPSMVGRIPTGGVFEVLAPVTGAIDLGVNATRVFVQTAAGIVSCTKDGCAGAATDYLPTTSAKFFVVDDANLYWLDKGGALSSCAATTATCSVPVAITSIPTGPTVPPAGCLALDAKSLYIGRYRGIDVFDK